MSIKTAASNDSAVRDLVRRWSRRNDEPVLDFCTLKRFHVLTGIQATSCSPASYRKDQNMSTLERLQTQTFHKKADCSSISPSRNPLPAANPLSHSSSQSNSTDAIIPTGVRFELQRTYFWHHYITKQTASSAQRQEAATRRSTRTDDFDFDRSADVGPRTDGVRTRRLPGA